MIDVFVTNIEGKLAHAEIETKNSWISLTNPTLEELIMVQEKTGAPMEFLQAPLDSEESSRIDVEDEKVLVIVNASIEEEVENDIMEYTTIPIGIIVLPNHIITISIEELACIERFKVIGSALIQTNKKTRFTLQIIYQMATKYLQDLTKIDHKTEEIEESLYVKMEDNLLLDLLKLEKTLVYFRNSLRADAKVMNKLFRSSYLRRYEEDEDLLEDALIELQQAIEMADTNSSIIRSMRDGVASLMSNQLNNTMKTLAGITIVLTVPTMVFSFYGMNTAWSKTVTTYQYYNVFVLLITVTITICVYFFMKKRNLF